MTSVELGTDEYDVVEITEPSEPHQAYLAEINASVISSHATGVPNTVEEITVSDDNNEPNDSSQECTDTDTMVVDDKEDPRNSLLKEMTVITSLLQEELLLTMIVSGGQR